MLNKENSESHFPERKKSNTRRLSKAWGTIMRKFSTAGKKNVRLDFDVRTIYSATAYIENCIDEGNENNINRLYHPQYQNPNSSRELQVRVCQQMIRGEFEHCQDFALFSDVHVVAEAIKLVLKEFAPLQPSTLYTALKNSSKPDDIILSDHGKFSIWKNYNLFLHIIHHLSKLCEKNESSQKNDENVLAKVFGPIFFPDLNTSKQKQIIIGLIHYINECSQKKKSLETSDLKIPSNDGEYPRVNAVSCTLDPRIIALYKRHFQVMTKAQEQLNSARIILQIVVEKS